MTIVYDSEGTVVTSPLFLLSTAQTCSLCGTENTVVALAPAAARFDDEPEEDDGCLLSYIEALPPEILAEIHKRHPNYEIQHSLTADADYFMTICDCGGHYGDFHVFQRISDQAFRAPGEVHVERLPLTGSWVIPCSCGQCSSVADLIGGT